MLIVFMLFGALFGTIVGRLIFWVMIPLAFKLLHQVVLLMFEVLQGAARLLGRMVKGMIWFIVWAAKRLKLWLRDRAIEHDRLVEKQRQHDERDRAFAKFQAECEALLARS